MSRALTVAEQFPARVDSNGRAWFRPARPAGVDMAQWGWTSQPALAHADYGTGPHVVVHVPTATAVKCGGPGACVACDHDRQTGGLHPEGTCGAVEGCSGCVGVGDGGPAMLEAGANRLAAVVQAHLVLRGAGSLW
ncbi:hypothetical protein I5G87_gp75 [Mycobacterium phage Ekdilam]|uniref:Uncharacterized protein n=1 Tax=Mycobacterium phage Ekdilam TaxID=2599862 RepID=A0A5J6TNV6_9CAUD|nr:hypothetical protein I5G87_gp75 [Mycobacterium phage Ekdilam]QFG11499.1 hypothetical protein PBI_EKDILAM_75 [Mycobacterium phage Ekdilam]